MADKRSSLIDFYGDEALFQKKLKEGFTGIILGRGSLVRGIRVVAFWAFFRSDGHIETVARIRFPDPETGRSTYGSDACDHDPASFKKYLRQYHIDISERLNLSDFLERIRREKER